MSKLAEIMSKFDISEVKDSDHGSHVVGLSPIFIVPIVFVIVLLAGFVMRLMMRNDKKAIKTADIIMVIGFLGVIISVIIILVLQFTVV